MNDHLDDRIRALFEELDEASPEAPPMPMPPEPAQRPVWQRRLVPAMGLAVVVLMMGVVAQVLFRGPASDEGEATATTEAAAEGGGGGPVETRPPGFVLVLADLNLACTRYEDASSDAVPIAPVGDQAHLDALKALVDPTSALSSSITSASEDAPGSGIDGPAVAADDLVLLVEKSAAGPPTGAEDAYRQYAEDVGTIGSDLAELGALDCSDLAGSLP